MAKTNEAQAPVNDSLPVEDKKFAVIIDQDGLFLRVERNEVELEEDKEYEVYEEVVDKGEETVNEENPGTPVAPHANDADRCETCEGTGLKGDFRCAECEGSGKAK